MIIQTADKIEMAFACESCFLARGWVTDTSRSQVTNANIQADDWHEIVLKTPTSKSQALAHIIQN